MHIYHCTIVPRKAPGDEKSIEPIFGALCQPFSVKVADSWVRLPTWTLNCLHRFGAFLSTCIFVFGTCHCWSSFSSKSSADLQYFSRPAPKTMFPSKTKNPRMSIVVDNVYLDPAKDVFFLVRAIFRRSSKNPHNKQFWCRFLSLLRCFLSLLRHFGVMFSIANLLHVFASCFLARRKKDIVSGSRYIYIIYSFFAFHYFCCY